MNRYANIGLGVHTKSHARRQGGPVVGYTPPAVIWDKMNEVNASALGLDASVQPNVQREAFKAAWAAWLTAWKAFYEKYQSTVQRLGAFMYSDDLAAQVETYRVELVSWYEAYGREVDAQGKPLPPPGSEPPKTAPGQLPDHSPDQGLSIPWWVWMVGGAAVVGVGYLTYRHYMQTKRRVESMLPIVMGGTMGPTGVQLAHAATANDPGPPTLGYLPPHYATPLPYPYGR